MMISPILNSLIHQTSSNQPTLCVITGPTAVGKTDFAIEVALHFDTVIISADSRQFYREMCIGTAFPTEEQQSKVKHYFIGHKSIQDYYSVSKYEQDVLELLPSLFEQHPVVVMTGGSGLYIDAVCYGIDLLPDPDPEVREELTLIFEKEGVEGLRQRIKKLDPHYYQTSDIANYKRLLRALEVTIQTGKPYSQMITGKAKERDFNIQKFYLNRPRAELFERINLRVDQMMQAGLLDEVQQLYPYKDLNALNTVGYKELFSYLDGKSSLEQAVEKIKVHTRRYAKRQLTWFKRDSSYQEIKI
ncbi:MAG TPA: tRNA (adenosine(37)-N6)-dimethylallyltransferase MiaA [Bacteroidales bacterium]|nr:tRNA (adenosine(37)-N6)-dimethylallyltransferase MiaA [Bacteroidales bacterium]HOH23385.1 tRNA (adenosine(37)-N6)-dimethylallyltransferase MiaA [Bacteroidales bacterium]HPB57724.1 tRNA (adenosine(37)-N6)-dimethylallyltransferase MiaA [Bacteroidales bacterium]HPZ04290.1 tRNA (adenosine(37)-N6)-dimethylallyltransferase MiaA [Bacteroidales bacterium]HQB74529.1 tRNA (adenosine(37)-N6)-dimethylallyltransferase MiaA [Bacteroidales bacterium]